MKSYDSHGWLSQAEIPGRTTGATVPQHGAKTVGQPYPNFTGVEWVLATYSEPLPPPGPTNAELNAPIIAEIKALEESNQPRALREASLGDTAGLTMLDNKVKALREKLKW